MKVVINFGLVILLLVLCSGVNGQTCYNVCEWSPWKAWSDCSASCGGGSRSRNRPMCCSSQYKTFTECVNACGKQVSAGREYGSCNQICLNGGVFSGYSCQCPESHYGSCCNYEITCGTPSPLPNGAYSTADYKYGGTVYYTCDKDYQLTKGDASFVCSKQNAYSSTGYWKGSTGVFPYCAYMSSCASIPCLNNGTCHNLPDSYNCTCKSGYSGTNCEFDIQPPVFTNCPSSFTNYSAEGRLTVTWSEPEVFDPNNPNTEFYIRKNYPTSSGVFHWGDFTVSYFAEKKSNGFQSECAFNVSVRPFPCTELMPPTNGAFACNGWNSDYTEVCALFCQAPFTTTPDIDIKSLFVCGATGHWKPPKTDVSCTANISPNTILNDHHFTGPCNKTHSAVQSAYIELLQASDWSELCTEPEWKDSCVPSNVHIIC